MSFKLFSIQLHCVPSFFLSVKTSEPTTPQLVYQQNGKTSNMQHTHLYS